MISSSLLSCFWLDQIYKETLNPSDLEPAAAFWEFGGCVVLLGKRGDNNDDWFDSWWLMKWEIASGLAIFLCRCPGVDMTAPVKD